MRRHLKSRLDEFMHYWERLHALDIGLENYRRPPMGDLILHLYRSWKAEKMTRYQDGVKAVSAQAAQFLSGMNVVVDDDSQFSAVLIEGTGDGVVTGRVRLTIEVDVDLAINPFPYGEGAVLSTVEAG